MTQNINFDNWYEAIGALDFEQALAHDGTLDEVTWLNDEFIAFTSAQEDHAYHSYKDDLLMEDN